MREILKNLKPGQRVFYKEGIAVARWIVDITNAFNTGRGCDVTFFGKEILQYPYKVSHLLKHNQGYGLNLIHQSKLVNKNQRSLLHKYQNYWFWTANEERLEVSHRHADKFNNLNQTDWGQMPD